MNDYSQVPIIQCSYNIAVQIQKLAASYPKNYHHTLGSKTANTALEFFTSIIEANFIRDYQARSQAIEHLQTQLFTLGMKIRMAKDLKLISRNSHAELHEKLIDIRKQLKGWKHWSDKQT